MAEPFVPCCTVQPDGIYYTNNRGEWELISSRLVLTDFQFSGTKMDRPQYENTSTVGSNGD